MIGTSYWLAVGALVLVLVLIFALAWVAKRLGLGGHLTAGRGKRRLGVQEVLSLDNKRRLVLLKRDGVEHLILLGLNDDVVVETGIVPPAEQPGETASGQGRTASFANLLSGTRP
jgi:flagellar protein FliO/FliZ